MTPTQPQVTQDDMNAAADFLESWEPGPEMTVVKLARVLAAHRQQSENALRKLLDACQPIMQQARDKGGVTELYVDLANACLDARAALDGRAEG